MKHYAIIVAGGSGSRMQTETPKQFLLLKNLPILMHTIMAFAQSHTKPEIIVVLHASLHKYWARCCEEFGFKLPHTIINSGTERFHSVKNALLSIKEEGYVAIHDAVRPLVSSTLIDSCFKQTETLGNAIAAIQPSDSIRLLKNNKTSALNRNEIYLVQTPQTFSLEILKEAYKQTFQTHFTDDANVVESAGYEINIIDGERNNIKITYPIDLKLAELLLKE